MQWFDGYQLIPAIIRKTLTMVNTLTNVTGRLFFPPELSLSSMGRISQWLGECSKQRGLVVDLGGLPP